MGLQDDHSTGSARLVGGTLITIILIAAWKLLFRGSVRQRFPPGPPPQPLVGNLKDIPSGGNEWDAYEALGKKCGKVPYAWPLRAAQDISLCVAQ